MQPPASPADQANQQLVDRLIAEGALWSPPLIAAFRATPRHRFLDRIFQYQRKRERWREVLTRDPTPETLRLLYSDRALITRLSPGGHRQAVMPISSSSQPSLMGQMLEDLKLAPGLRVLEVGAGTGYNAALLAHAVAPGPVLSVEVDREVLAQAWDHLRAFPDRRVELRHGDGRQGCPDAAPFGRIVVTAATPDVEPAWLEQLADRGLLQAPLTFAPGLAFIVRGSVTEGVFHGRLTRAAYFMPLRAEAETGASETEPPPREALRSLPAPWAGWFDRRRPRVGWLGFSQSLAFYGLLRGLRVHYRALDGQPGYGVHGPEGDAVCWFGSQEWHVSGGAGRDLGTWLWRAFLEAGGPWPTEFRLKAAPGGGLHPAGRRETYVRHGPRCQQLWELSEPRDRPAWL